MQFLPLIYVGHVVCFFCRVLTYVSLVLQVYIAGYYTDENLKMHNYKIISNQFLFEYIL